MGQDLVLVTQYDNIFNPASIANMTIDGLFFDNVHGFVDVSTPTPIAFASVSQMFPNSGQILLAGNASGVTVTALSSTRVQLQRTGDSFMALMNWTELAGPIGADIADADGDGVHDSWETANGLSPTNAADAALDNDGDGARNFVEYLAGTDPNNAGSIPPFPGYAVSLLANSDLIFDPVTQRIYAAVRGNPGAITPIDPINGKIGTAIPVGIDPVKLARSDNGQYLYAGLDGVNAIQRIDLATQSVNLTFSLGSDGADLLFVDDMEVLPGAPQSIAVSRKKKGISPRHAGVAIFDDNVQRATTTPGFIGSNVIEFSASAASLYGYSTEVVPSSFFRMTVGVSGVSVLDATQNLINDLSDIEFEGGLIYSIGGSVTNPQTLMAEVPFPGLPGIPFTKSVRPDASIGRVFFLTQEPLQQIGQTAVVSAYNLNTKQLIDSVNIPGVIGDPGNLIRWGAKGLAFRTAGGQIFLIESTKLIP
jgi:hypothetical protein